MTNVVVLIGRLTRDVELRKTPSGMSFARFTLAVNRRFKKDQGADADFISCVAWDKRAEVMYQYLGKGSQIGIEGRIQTGSYEKDGQRVYTTDVVVEALDFLDSKTERTQGQPAYSQTTTAGKYGQYDEEPILDIASDDLPF